MPQRHVHALTYLAKIGHVCPVLPDWLHQAQALASLAGSLDGQETTPLCFRCIVTTPTVEVGATRPLAPLSTTRWQAASLASLKAASATAICAAASARRRMHSPARSREWPRDNTRSSRSAGTTACERRAARQSPNLKAAGCERTHAPWLACLGPDEAAVGCPGAAEPQSSSSSCRSWTRVYARLTEAARRAHRTALPGPTARQEREDE